MDALHFLNLQYWYCIIYSFFGGGCAYLDELRAAQGGASGDLSGAIGPDQSAFEVLFGWFASAGSALWNAAAFAASSVWSVIEGPVSFLWSAYSALAWGFSLFLALLILFSAAGLALIRFRELSVYGTLPPKSNEENVRNHRWQELLGEAMSSDPKRWRFALLEADKMLGELLEKLGYAGATTADKMRALPEDAFVTVPVAWEAHRVRNLVSLGSSDFILTQREAFRVMKLYEQVFEEFSFI